MMMPAVSLAPAPLRPLPGSKRMRRAACIGSDGKIRPDSTAPDSPATGGLFSICRKAKSIPIQKKGTCMENIEQRVRKIVAEQLGVNEADVKNESSFVNDLGADSLDTVELVMALEEEFETEIPDEEAEKIRTVGDAIEYVKAHQ